MAHNKISKPSTIVWYIILDDGVAVHSGSIGSDNVLETKKTIEEYPSKELMAHRLLELNAEHLLIEEQDDID